MTEKDFSPLVLLSDVETLKDTELYGIFLEDINIMKEFFAFEEIEQNQDLIIASPEFENFKKNFENYLRNKINYYAKFFTNLIYMFYINRPKLLFILPHLFSILLNVFQSKTTEFETIVSRKKYFFRNDSYFWKLIKNIFFKNEKIQLPQTLELFSREENEDVLFEILFHDDCDRLISYLSINESLDIDATIKIPYEHKLHELLLYKDDFTSYLNICSLFGSAKCFKYLILNNCSITNRTPIYSIAGGSTEIIQILNQRNVSFRNSCFVASITYHRYSLSDWLISNFGYEKLKLPICIEKLNFESFIFFSNNLQSFDDFGPNHNSSLHLFCSIGCLSAVKYLFNHGCTKDPRNKNEKTPLHKACIHNHLEIVEYLISNGCDKEAQDINLMTPLHYACSNGYLPIVEYLISQKCNIECKCKLSGRTPLHIACYYGFLPIVEYLISHGADKESVDEDGYTPLHIACESDDDLEIVEYLISQQCNKESKSLDGNTPLHHACECGCFSIVEYLVSHGCDTNSRNNSGLCPEHLADLTGHHKIHDYLMYI